MSFVENNQQNFFSILTILEAYKYFIQFHLYVQCNCDVNFEKLLEKYLSSSMRENLDMSTGLKFDVLEKSWITVEKLFNCLNKIIKSHTEYEYYALKDIFNRMYNLCKFSNKLNLELSVEKVLLVENKQLLIDVAKKFFNVLKFLDCFNKQLNVIFSLYKSLHVIVFHFRKKNW